MGTVSRILVMGPFGAGKTTLSKRVGQSLGLPVVHLDREFWLPGYRKPEPGAWLEKVARLSVHDRWVMDGNYLDTIECRIARTHALVWLDLPRRVYMPRLLSRIVRHLGRERDDLGDGVVERLHVPHLLNALAYPSNRRPLIRAVAERCATTGVRVYVLRSGAAVDRFVGGLPHPFLEGSFTR